MRGVYVVEVKFLVSMKSEGDRFDLRVVDKDHAVSDVFGTEGDVELCVVGCVIPINESHVKHSGDVGAVSKGEDTVVMRLSELGPDVGPDPRVIIDRDDAPGMSRHEVSRYTESGSNLDHSFALHEKRQKPALLSRDGDTFLTSRRFARIVVRDE